MPGWDSGNGFSFHITLNALYVKTWSMRGYRSFDQTTVKEVLTLSRFLPE